MEKMTRNGEENLACQKDEVTIIINDVNLGNSQARKVIYNDIASYNLENETRNFICDEKDVDRGLTEVESRHLEENVDLQDSFNKNAKGSRKWLVFGAGYLTSTFVIGFAFNLSILYIEWLDEFGKSNSETALPQSICTGTVNIAAFPSSLLVTKYGPRKCGMLGGIIATSGLVASSFATSIPLLSIFLGIAGFGMSLAYISSTTCVETYFTGRLKIIVLAFLMFGSGAGMAIFPLLLEYLIIEFGWRGTILIVAGMMLNLVVNSCLFTTPRVSNKLKINTSFGKEHTSADISTIDNLQQQSIINIGQPNNNSTEMSVENSETGFPNNMMIGKQKCVRDILNTLIRDKIYVIHAVSTATCVTTFNTILIFFVDFYQSKGISESRAIRIYMYMNIISTITRLFPGILKRLPHTSVQCLPVLSTLFGCISTATFPFAGSSYAFHLMATSAFGIGFGFALPVITVTTVKLLGPGDFTVGVGICMALNGIFTVTAGPISGYIRDTTGNYDVSFFCASAVLFMSCVSFLVIMVYRYYLKHRKSSSALETVNSRSMTDSVELKRYSKGTNISDSKF